MQLDDAATILGRADFFDVCNAEQRRLLAFASERKRFRPGAVIYASGDTPEGAHVLVSGTVATTHDGSEDDPYLIHAGGAVLGVMGLVVAKPRPVTLKAVGLRTAGFRFGSTVLREGEIAFVASRPFSTGAGQPMFVLA